MNDRRIVLVSIPKNLGGTRPDSAQWLHQLHADGRLHKKFPSPQRHRYPALPSQPQGLPRRRRPVFAFNMAGLDKEDLDACLFEGCRGRESRGKARERKLTD